MNYIQHLNPSVKRSEIFLERYASDIYNCLRCNDLDYDIFKMGLKGYFYLKSINELNNSKVLTIVDYNQSALEKRLFVIDLCEKKLLYNEQIAHATNSGKEYAKTFSNKMESEKSSLGFFITGRTYWGTSGYSLKLFGLDNGFNNNAFSRGIVFHGTNGKERDDLTSKGCLIVNQEVSSEIIETIKEGSCLFVYFPDKKYLENSIFRKFTPCMMN